MPPDLLSRSPRFPRAIDTAIAHGSWRGRRSLGNARSARRTSRRFGDATPPDGPILAILVEDLVEKEAMLAAHTEAFFTIPHFDGYAAVLIRMKSVTKAVLRDALLIDGWLACAPPPLARDYLAR